MTSEPPPDVPAEHEYAETEINRQPHQPDSEQQSMATYTNTTPGQITQEAINHYDLGQWLGSVHGQPSLRLYAIAYWVDIFFNSNIIIIVFYVTTMMLEKLLSDSAHVHLVLSLIIHFSI